MKNQKHLDTRVQYTRTVLKNAMLTLLKEKSYEKITVKELCEAAEINRGTFYLHYASPVALLKDIENQFVSENMQIFDSYWQGGRSRNLIQNLFSCIQKDGGDALRTPRSQWRPTVFAQSDRVGKRKYRGRVAKGVSAICPGRFGVSLYVCLPRYDGADAEVAGGAADA